MCAVGLVAENMAYRGYGGFILRSIYNQTFVGTNSVSLDVYLV